MARGGYACECGCGNTFRIRNADKYPTSCRSCMRAAKRKMDGLKCDSKAWRRERNKYRIVAGNLRYMDLVRRKLRRFRPYNAVVLVEGQKEDRYHLREWAGVSGVWRNKGYVALPSAISAAAREIVLGIIEELKAK